MKKLFSPLKIRNLEFKNRIAVSPMCQYSAIDGVPTDWHLVHLGARAIGGAALVIAEATAVSPEGRISPDDTGIWNDVQMKAFRRITDFIHSQGTHAGIQLAHAGRKASMASPWKGGKYVPPEQGGWTPIGPSAIRFSPDYPMPTEMSLEQIETFKKNFVAAAQRSLTAGFDVIELHMAHGYLLNEFLSPLSNSRTDSYGGSFENRSRLAVEIAQAVRAVWPKNLPLFARISATDWVEGGFTVEESIQLGKVLKECGVDLIDCSSGGNSPAQKIPVGPGYQVHLAEKVKKESHIFTGAVGMITQAEQAELILAENKADLIFVARELLRDPQWPLRAAHQLKVDVPWPKQYDRGKFHD